MRILRAVEQCCTHIRKYFYFETELSVSTRLLKYLKEESELDRYKVIQNNLSDALGLFREFNYRHDDMFIDLIEAVNICELGIKADIHLLSHGRHRQARNDLIRFLMQHQKESSNHEEA